MKSREPLFVLGALLILLFAPALAGKEEALPLDQVPEVVMQAALAAVPGIVFDRAKREVEKGVTVYELTGTAEDKTYEVEVNEAGKVLEVEQGQADDDEDDEGEEDDDAS